MEEDALIGYTGFVGGSLAREHEFAAVYNSQNIAEIAGRRFRILICAGAPAEKWKANADPETDFASLGLLMRSIANVRAERVVLISTVDVYPVPANVDESTPIDEDVAAPYGRHRRMLERFIGDRFQTTTIRLPGLYGRGLKKNAIFDLLNHNHVERIDSRSVFQFYGLHRLAADIKRALEARLALVNLATEPVSIAEIADVSFGERFLNELSGTPPYYDVQSRHASLFGGAGRYVETKRNVLAGIGRFVADARARQ